MPIKNLVCLVASLLCAAAQAQTLEPPQSGRFPGSGNPARDARGAAELLAADDFHARLLRLPGNFLCRFPELHGARGDGASDDSSAIEATAASLGRAGGEVCLDPSKVYFVSGLTIPANVSLVGGMMLPDNPGGANVPTPPDTANSILYDHLGGIALAAAGTIRLGGNSGIRNVFIKPAGMTFPVASAAAFKGTAITFTKDSPQVRNVTILGFDTCIGIDAAARAISRYRIDGVNLDCQTGIKINKPSNDTSLIRDVHIWPFTSAHLTTKAALTRSGTGLWLEGAQDDTRIDNVLALGFLKNFYFTSVSAVSVGKIWSDYPVNYASGSGSVGVFFDLHVDGIVFDQAHVWGSENGVVQNSNPTEKVKFANLEVKTIAANAISIAGGDMHIGALDARNVSNSLFVIGNSQTKIYARGTAYTAHSVDGINDTRTLVVAPRLGKTENLDIQLFTDKPDGTQLFTGNSIDPRTITGAATIALPVKGDTFIISGSASINTISGGHGGRSVTLLFANATNLTSAGNISTAFTALANSRVDFTFYAAIGKWVPGAIVDRTAWSTWAPNVTPAKNAILRTGAINAAYKQIGKTIFYRVSIEIAENGTGAVALQASLHSPAVGATQTAAGRNLATGTMLQCIVSGGLLSIVTFDNRYPVASGQTISCSGSYEAL